MTVRQLLRNMDSVEISEWQAYFQIENEKYDPEKKKGDLNERLKKAFGKKE